MNKTIFTKICTKYGFRVEKEIAPWNDGSDWYVAYIPSDKFNVAVAAYDPEDEDVATICISLKKINLPVKIKVANTKDVRTVEDLERACMELNVKFKEMLEQIKLEQINSDF
jgi:hypothetical protein